LLISASIYVIRKILNRNSIEIDDNLATSFKNMQKKNKGHVDKNFFKNVARLLKICFPKLISREIFGISFLLVSMVSRTFLSIYMAEVTSNIVKMIVKKDFSSFLSLVLVLGALSLPGAFLNSGIEYMQKQLSLYFRENLCTNLQNKMLENKSYYKLTNLDSRIRNPDQVFTSDIEKFSNSLSSLFINFTKPLLDVIFFFKKLSETIGYTGPLMLIGWYIGSGVIMRFITPPFGQLAAIEQGNVYYLF